MSPRARVSLAVALGGALAVALLAGTSARAPEGERKSESTVLSWTTPEVVEASLARSRALAGARVRAEGDDLRITLTGDVRDELQRQQALRIAAQTAGVREVQDRLRIDPSLPAPAVRPDEDLARDVARKLAADSQPEASAKPGLVRGWRVEGDGWQMDVEVEDGDVSLEGVVLLQPHIHAFVLAAREVPGVRSVRAELALRPNPAADDPFHQ